MALAAGAASAQTQLEMNERAGNGLRQAEARMDAVYAKVLARISDTGKENLQSAQETWLRFRDQECEFETMGTKVVRSIRWWSPNAAGGLLISASRISRPRRTARRATFPAAGSR